MAGRLYKMGTLAELTGLSPILLRAWERRHDLLCPERTAGGHRLYIGRVLKMQHQAVPPLVYHGGHYHLLGEVL